MRYRSQAVLSAFFILASIIAVSADKKKDGEITVAAAADLGSALKDIITDFEKQSGIHVKLSLGSSGALTQQVQNGAPFDVFLSADMDYPRHLIENGFADGESLYAYAIGNLALWTLSDSPLDVEDKGMNVLVDASVKKISIANPQHAPYGRAAVAAMKHVGIYDQVADRLVLGENVAQAAQFVESGNAQVGFVALAHALDPAMKGKGKYWKIPLEAYPALNQGLVVISHSRRKKQAKAFADFMKSKQATVVLERYGFDLPGPQPQQK